ncbi:non-homologous end-joining DNA ligase [Nocardioides nitrophenolicus]|uniref:non-homologous end-joining DNA ligase n=1 Tax=Nocardioides nitrophenolicus TaxID=60489 RepID=UPI0027DC3571|nr:non-homologous end-joining DNA ligase [Nocardioides nitrophenolicus]MBM7515749.1 bifunctional non-homologous end joining protein LigD [Nocardioides nitrophenolicus]
MPDLRPMLATAGTHVPRGEEWCHEVKWDGVRALAALDGGPGATVTLTSRNGNRITPAWPDLVTPPAGVRDLVVDGEIIALNERGLPDFRVVAERMHVRNATTAARLATRIPVTYMVFDLLRLDGEDLCPLPLHERRRRLAELDLGRSGWQVPAEYDDGAMLREATRAQGLEGIVSKRRDSPYRPGERTHHWLKFAHRHRASFVVGGWRSQTGTTGRLAALLVGEPTADGLAYRGRVGSGIGPKQSRALAALLGPLTRGASPFADEVPRVDAEGTTWVEPVVVVDVDTHGLGYERLRQPSYQGVRADLTPEDL